jgi:hypothetical protein
VEIAEILDTNSTVFGTAHLHLSGSAPGTSPTSRVRISQADSNTANDDSVFLCPIPWRLGTSLLPSDSNHRGALHWRGAVPYNNLNNDDLQGVIEMGGNYVRADAFKRNTFSINITSGGYGPQGFEDVILMDNTGVRTVSLRATNSAYYRASTNMRVFTIVDSAGTAQTSPITISANGSDTINGSNNYVINSQYGSVKIGTTGNGKWFILP